MRMKRLAGAKEKHRIHEEKKWCGRVSERRKVFSQEKKKIAHGPLQKEVEVVAVSLLLLPSLFK